MKWSAPYFHQSHQRFENTGRKRGSPEAGEPAGHSGGCVESMGLRYFQGLCFKLFQVEKKAPVKNNTLPEQLP